MKIQINSKEQGFWKEKSVEDVVTQATLVHIMISHLHLFQVLFKLQDFPAELWQHFRWDICVMITLMFLLNF
jgi:hypothetical protein